MKTYEITNYTLIQSVWAYSLNQTVLSSSVNGMGFYHSLMAPIVNPLIICFWKDSIKTNTGMIARVMPAVR
jgi:hypothetical protein